MTTQVSTFDSFFFELYGHAPFPWQRRLVGRILSGEGWPSLVQLPTASGKTALIDIAVFCLAAEAGTARRRTPRRVFFIVDRRLVVDAAFERADRLAARLREAQHGVLAEVAARLRTYGGEEPLRAAILRGGMVLDQGWARDPAQPLVCVSTVDQVGSRLLFRGYGVGDRALAVHAALVGVDALLVLDEAHVSHAFAETLSRVARYRTWGHPVADVPWHVIRMSATLPDADIAFTLDEADRADPELGRRLTTKKVARLVEVSLARSGQEGDAEAARRLEQAVVERMCSETRQLLAGGQARVIAVVVNQVGTARAVFRHLRDDLAGDGVDVVLLTGRIRPLDRDALWARYGSRLVAGRVRRPDDPPLVLVATQAIEVGADLDFDALVTEAAPLDALRQRVGRLDRLGRLGSAPVVVVARADRLTDDPLYGPAVGATWAWLLREAQGEGGRRRGRGAREPVLDLGPSALEARLPRGADLEPLCTPRARAPVLLPGHLDLWVQTSPRPSPDPDVSWWLHGSDDRAADVTIVWRSDLMGEDQDAWSAVVAALPPLGLEGLAVWLPAARAFLRGSPAALSDVERGLAQAEDGQRGPVPPVLRWAGPDDPDTRLVGPDDVRPGDTLVIPSSYGGADTFGWDPLSQQAVVDLAEEAYERARGAAVVRLHPSLVPSEARAGSAALLLGQLRERLAEEPEQPEAVAALALQAVVDDDTVPEPTRRRARRLLEVGPVRWRLTLYPDGAGLIVVERTPREPVADDGDAGSFPERVVPLEDHQAAVAERVRRWASSCAVPPDLAETLVLAAGHHDEGKRDPRFQVLLYAGDEVAAALGPPAAKSGIHYGDVRVRRLARARSGLPLGYRHEATSVALLSTGVWSDRVDRDLLLHLVASHHGWARPFFPPVDDPHPVSVRWRGGAIAPPVHGLAEVGSGVAARFWTVVRRYGWYGAAYLEAILRLADQRESEVRG